MEAISSGSRTGTRVGAAKMLNKVPEVTIYFWIIKVLCTTVGETFADYLNTSLGFGLNNTTWVMSVVLLVSLYFQFRLGTYVPSVYWWAVVWISVVGTLITDNMVENLGVSLTTSTIAFSIALAITFAVWFGFEKTLSIHSIVTTRREAFYWVTVLFTFALGTASGDLTAEKLNVGYWKSALIFGGAIALVFFAHRFLKLGPILGFWIAYILTRPLGASIGDELSQSRHDGGLALGTTVTSLIFLGAILTTVIFLTITRLDRTELRTDQPGEPSVRVLVVAHKTAATPALLDAIRDRARRGPCRFLLIVPNPIDGLGPGHRQVAWKESEGGQVLALALPLMEEAAGAPVDGAVSTIPDPFEVIETAVRDHGVDEIILSTLPHRVSHWLHIDLPARIKTFGLPVTTVVAQHEARTAAA